LLYLWVSHRSFDGQRNPIHGIEAVHGIAAGGRRDGDMAATTAEFEPSAPADWRAPSIVRWLAFFGAAEVCFRAASPSDACARDAIRKTSFAPGFRPGRNILVAFSYLPISTSCIPNQST
jgi:hypothetical protein